MGGEKVEGARVMPLLMYVAMKEKTVYFGIESFFFFFRSIIMQPVCVKIEVIQ